MRRCFRFLLLAGLVVLSLPALVHSGQNDLRVWRADLSDGQPAVHTDVAFGVTVVNAGNLQKMTSEFTVAAGIDPGSIELSFPGATLAITNGEARVFAGDAVIRVLPPGAWQQTGKQTRQNLESRFRVVGSSLFMDVDTFDETRTVTLRLITIFPEGDLFGSTTTESGIPSVDATLTDLLVVDANSNSIVNPGDVLEYTTQIDNTGSDGAQDVDFSLTLDANTTLLPGSVQTTPLAFDDSYDAIGNVPLSVNAAGGVLANDEDPDGDALTVVDADTVSNQGGEVAVATDGSFTYTAMAGFTGSDFFTYTLQDDDSNQRTAMVSVQVDSLIWFVDNSGSNGDGRFGSPLNNLADAQNATTGGDYIFVYAGSGSYGGGITLDSGQRLIGQGVSLTVDGTLIVSSGSRPVITNNAGNGITLSSNNTIRGLTVSGTSGDGINGTGAGLVTVNKVGVGNAGASAIDLTSCSLAVSLDSLGSSGSADGGVKLSAASGSLTVSGTSRISTAGAVGISISSSSATVTLNSVDIDNITGVGIRLTNNSGPVSINGGDITGTSGVAFDVDQGNGTINYAGTINNTAGRSVEITNRTGGAITLSGSITDNSGTGILVQNNTAGSGSITFSGSTITLNTGSSNSVNLDNNDSHTISFSATNLDIDATSGTGFRAANGGTVNVTGNNNSITTTTGTGLRIENTTIGSSDLTFKSISANGATNGIVLTNTGSSGGLTVTGDGSTPGSGGTIQNTTGDAVSISGTRDLSLSYMNFTAPDFNAIDAVNLSGTNLLDNCNFSNFNDNVADPNMYDGIRLANTGVVFTEIRVRNCSILQTNSRGNDGISITATGAVSGQIFVEDSQVVGHANHNSTFSGLTGDGIGVSIGESSGSGTVGVFVKNIEFINAVNPNGRGGVAFKSNGSAVFNDIEVRDCSFDDLFNFSSTAGLIDLAPGGTSTMTAIIDDNTLSGNALPTTLGAKGIRIENVSDGLDNLGNLDITINDNTIDDTELEAIDVDLGSAASGSANIIITNNIIGASTPVGDSGTEGIEIRFFHAGFDFKTMNLLMSDNVVTNADNSSGDETVDIDCEDNTTINATVTGNTFTSLNGSASDEFEITTEDGGSTICLDLKNNTVSEPPGPFGPSFRLDESSGTFNVEGSGFGDVTQSQLFGSPHSNIGSAVNFSFPPPTNNNNTNCMEPN